MELARRATDQVSTNGSPPLLLAMPAPSEAEMRARSLRAVGGTGDRRPSVATLAALATIAGIAALALGSSAFVNGLRSDADNVSESASTVALGQAIALVSKPGTQRIPLAGSDGTIVLAVGSGGGSVLVLDGLAPAPAGESYQAWLIGTTGKVSSSVAVFAGDEPVVPLTRLVARGSGIGVTLERAGGAPAPTRTIELVARRD